MNGFTNLTKNKTMRVENNLLCEITKNESQKFYIDKDTGFFFSPVVDIELGMILKEDNDIIDTEIILKASDGTEMIVNMVFTYATNYRTEEIENAFNPQTNEIYYSYVLIKTFDITKLETSETVWESLSLEMQPHVLWRVQKKLEIHMDSNPESF